MNQPPENSSSSESEAIRSDIDNTRETIDDTIGAIGERLKGRHLVDEVIGYFRKGDESSGSESSGGGLGEQANTLMHRAADTVRSNPIPAIMIGAGVAWMIYQSRQSSSNEDQYGDGNEDMELEMNQSRSYLAEDFSAGEGSETTGMQSGSQGGYQGSGQSGSQGESGGQRWPDYEDEPAQGKLAGLAARASDVGQKAKQGVQQVGNQAKALYGRAADRARQVTQRARSTVTEHPLEVGAACLAAGVLVGLLLPTPRKAARMARPLAQKVRQTVQSAGREAIGRGRKIVEAAAQAATEEAKNQGLVPGSGQQGGQGQSSGGSDAGMRAQAAAGNESGSMATAGSTPENSPPRA